MTTRNYSMHIVGDDILAVRRNGDQVPELFRRTGETANIRAIATSDAVIHDAELLDVFVDGSQIVLQEPYAGVRHRFTAVEFVKPALATFERVDPVFQDGGAQ